MEYALSSMGLTSLVIARPSLLDGNRKVLGQTDRTGEGIRVWLTRRRRPLVPVNYRAILAKDVANSLVRVVQTAKPGS